MKYKKIKTDSFPLIPFKVGEHKNIDTGQMDDVMRLSHLYACPNCHRVVDKLYQFVMPLNKKIDYEGTFWHETWCIDCIKKNKIKNYEELC